MKKAGTQLDVRPAFNFLIASKKFQMINPTLSFERFKYMELFFTIKSFIFEQTINKMDGGINVGSSGGFILIAGIAYGPASAPVNSAAGATNVGATITMADTTGMSVGMELSVTSGTGFFRKGTVIKSITSGTVLVASEAPLVSLSGSAVVTAHFNKTLEDLRSSDSTTTIVTLEEYVNGVSVDMLAQHGFLTNGTIPEGTVLKSYTGNGFSKVQVGVKPATAIILGPRKPRNFTDSVNSGINYSG